MSACSGASGLPVGGGSRCTIASSTAATPEAARVQALAACAMLGLEAY